MTKRIFFTTMLAMTIITVKAISYYEAGIQQQNPKLVARWTFDNYSLESFSDERIDKGYSISGNYKLAQGVSGSSIKMDGFTTQVRSSNYNTEDMERAFSVEAWIALATYPWNWSPVICQNDKELSGFYFGIGPRGEAGLFVSVNGKWRKCISKDRIDLKKWNHIAATFNSSKGLDIYINGKLSGTMELQGKLNISNDIEVLMGRNREKVVPFHPVRTYGTLPSWFSIDGMCDEIKLFSGVIAKQSISETVLKGSSAAEPDFPERVMPSGPDGPGKFGAYYTRLKYYEEWDALWRVSDHTDIVVRFDNSPIKVVFWRGTRYSPVWVMENGQWMADQSAEYFNRMEGCFEHMIDPHCLYSHVRIIENTDARVVVHWRYIPVSVRKNFSQVDEISGWQDCVDEYYTFYPDGIAVRKVIEHSTGNPIGPSESIVLCQPGSTPEDNINLDAMTLVNMSGESHTYSWANGAPEFKRGENPPDPVIQVVNLKSTNKPFTIFEPENNMAVFGIEQREDVSHFPWWNHWPVAQNPSDGRYCQAPDRASHFSLAWGGPPHHKGKDNTYWFAWLYGASTQSAKELAELARSWNSSPELLCRDAEIINKGYDKTQRAYILENLGKGKQGKIEFEFQATKESPMVNACIIFENLLSDIDKIRNGSHELKPGTDYHVGRINTLEGSKQVVWIENKSTTKESYTLTF
ncbi:MAG: LamG domain-containing protein [Deltaproteobacteria bacterium]|nr:LamG domain-containing protein [Deltaproteobacteria bacterium]